MIVYRTLKARPRNPNFKMHIDLTAPMRIEDNDCEDQGMTKISDGCYRCITFVDNKPVRTQFVNRNGFWTCPTCLGSYGEAPKPAYQNTCQENGSLCRAGQIDGITCPEDSCDIDDGVRHESERKAI